MQKLLRTKPQGIKCDRKCICTCDKKLSFDFLRKMLCTYYPILKLLIESKYQKSCFTFSTQTEGLIQNRRNVLKINCALIFDNINLISINKKEGLIRDRCNVFGNQLYANFSQLKLDLCFFLKFEREMVFCYQNC